MDHGAPGQMLLVKDMSLPRPCPMLSADAQAGRREGVHPLLWTWKVLVEAKVAVVSPTVSGTSSWYDVPTYRS